MLKKLKKFFKLGHDMPAAPLLEPVAIEPVIEHSYSELKAELPLEPAIDLPLPEIKEEQAADPLDTFLKMKLALDQGFAPDRDALANVLGLLPREESLDLVAGTKTDAFITESLRSQKDEIKKSHLLQTLMDAIDRGQEDRVREILDTLRASHPQRLKWLLSQTTSYTDHARRIFHKITALQYAAWNQDTPMRDLLRSYMDEKDINEQLAALDREGMNYSMPISDFNQLRAMSPEHAETAPIQWDDAETRDALESKDDNDDSDKFITLNEKHYDWGFRVCQSALQTYIDVVTPMEQSGQYNWNMLDKHWFDVGFAQRHLTVPYVNAYCCSTRFQPRPNFNHVIPERITTFYNYLRGKTEDFFDSLNNSGLGFSFGIVKGPEGEGRPRRGCAVGGAARGGGAGLDLAALSHLCEARTADYLALNEEIQQALNRPAKGF